MASDRMADARREGPADRLRDIILGRMIDAKGGSIMAKGGAKAKPKVRARVKTTAVKRSPKSSRKASRPARPSDFIVKARRKHDFLVKKFDPKDFKNVGLRSYALYRDLGIEDATHGMAVAHVIKLVGQCDPKVVSKLHTHEADFQMIYVLKGSMTGEYEGHGVHTLTEGDCWLQPKNIKHKVLDYSPDCELLEIVMPATFKTVELE